MPIASYRLPDRMTHRMVVGEPVRPASTGDEDLDVIVTTARCNQALERLIRARPGQWLWSQHRWRTRPSQADLDLWERAKGALDR
jgi:KDO2-lipid IV(A) lauroyltransferase